MLIPRGTLIGGKEKKKTHTNYCIAGYNSVVKGKKSGTKPCRNRQNRAVHILYLDYKMLR